MLCGLNCDLRSEEISPVMLFISNIILRNDFLHYFEEGVDRYCATGKPICLLGDVNINILRAQLVIVLNNFLIAYRAIPFFRQLINRQDCTINRN